MEQDLYKELLDNLYDGVYYVNQSKKITLWNKSAEKISGYSKSEVLGKCCADNILRHINDNGDELCIRGCPLGRTLKDGKVRESNLFLHHKNGHRVPISVRVAPIKNKQNIIIGAVEIFSENSKQVNLLEEVGKLKQEVFIDGLTQLGNRKFAQFKLTNQKNDIKTYGIQFGILFFDIDNFKSINDTWGHVVGDKVLKMVAKTANNIIRSVDTACRWGGDEFVVIVPNVDINSLRIIAEKIRIFIEKTWVDINGELLKTTISVGGAMAEQNDTIDSLIKKVDEQMYRCKKNGRNTISIK